MHACVCVCVLPVIQSVPSYFCCTVFCTAMESTKEMPGNGTWKTVANLTHVGDCDNFSCLLSI